MQMPANPDLLIDAFVFTDDRSEPDTAPPLALWEEVDRYQHLFERQLERTLSGNDPNAWQRLLSAMVSLQDVHEQSREEVRQLWATPAPPPADEGSLTPYLRNSIEGAIAEAHAQACLGTLTLSEETAITQCLQPLLENGETPQAYQFSGVMLSDGEHQAPWDGAVILHTLAEISQLPEPPWLLMYRFGVEGGWSTHANSEAAIASITAALGTLPGQQVTLERTSHTAFADIVKRRQAALAGPTGSDPQARDEHERAREVALQELTVPVNPARLLALARVEETRRSLQLGEHASTWLSSLAPHVASQLAQLITQYTAAIVASERLLRRDLPARSAYAATRVAEQLTTSFSLTEPCRVALKLPLQVTYARELISGSGAPGTPTRRVPQPSVDTELVTLEAIALAQLDDELEARLEFLDVDVVPSSHPQREALKAGITLTWLRDTLPRLDVAGDYERLQADAYLRAGEFKGSTDDEEVLLRPYVLMLRMHRLVAQAQRRIDARGALMAEHAARATTPQAWESAGMKLSLRPAALTVFDERTHSGGSTLAGVTFIHDSLSGVTLLYLPEAPGGRTFSQYPSLAAATDALADLFIDEGMRTYLCQRALEGEPAVLQSLVNQALTRRFYSLVRVGGAWPAHQSLARNQYLAALGLNISAHRASSMSSADRKFDKVDRSRAEAVGYIRLALGFLPFVGSAIAVWDALQAGIEAGRAFSSGDTRGGLEATESVLLSIADALFDLAPAVIAGGSSASLKATAQARQLRQGLQGAGRLRQLSRWSAQRADEAFHGYETNIRLTTMPGAEGRLRNIYSERGGNYILRGSCAYAVEWDDTLRTWRLAATRTRAYRQPVALDEAGNWQTHGHLYGQLVEGGLRGGGGVQSYVADRLDPLWPQSLRRLLPRWWTDAHLRRQQQLQSQNTVWLRTVIEREQVVTDRLERLKRGQGSQRDVVDAAEHAVEAAEGLYHSEQQYRELAHGRRFAAAGLDQSAAAATISAKSQLQIKLSFVEAERLTELALAQREELFGLVDQLSRDARVSNPLIGTLMTKAKEIRGTLNQMLIEYDRIERCVERLRLWERRVSIAAHRRKLHADSQAISQAFNQQSITLLRLGVLMDLAPLDDLGKPSWPYMRRLFTPARERFDRVAHASFSSESLSLRPQQRLRLKTQLGDASQQLVRVIERLRVSYPDQIDPAAAERLLTELRKVREGLPARQTPPPPTPGQPMPRVFEADDLLLIGEPVKGKRDMLVIPRVNNRQERWTRTTDHRWVMAEPPRAAPVVRPLNELVSHAEARLNELPAFRRRLQRYAHQRMLPADLEDLYLGESQELEYRIRQLRAADTEGRHTGLTDRLQREANWLREEGRLARVAQIKRSPNPTGGQLEYLIEANEVYIRKVGTLQSAGTTTATRNWLQEYAIFDSQNGEALFYAHFHYTKEQPRFGEFVAAHLKTPAQRFLGSAGAGEPAVWRGEISRSLAMRLFEPLFA